MKRILDLSAGNRGVWFNKRHADTVYADIRESVRPNVVADSRMLPFCDGKFDLVVFDPPHVNFGKNANMARNYGHHTAAEIRSILLDTGREAHRVTRPGAMMAFKWNSHDRSLAAAAGLMAAWWEMLFGHIVSTRTKHASTTHWVMLARRDQPIR